MVTKNLLPIVGTGSVNARNARHNRNVFLSKCVRDAFSEAGEIPACDAFQVFFIVVPH